jgi:hypothetical protein
MAPSFWGGFAGGACAFKGGDALHTRSRRLRLNAEAKKRRGCRALPDPVEERFLVARRWSMSG